MKKYYPENCTIQDWHKEAEEEIEQLNGSPINHIDVRSEMDLSVLSNVNCLPIRRPTPEMKGKHLGKIRKKIL